MECAPRRDSVLVSQKVSSSLGFSRVEANSFRRLTSFFTSSHTFSPLGLGYEQAPEAPGISLAPPPTGCRHVTFATAICITE